MSLRPKPVNFGERWHELQGSVMKIINLKNLERAVWDSRYFDIYEMCVAVPDHYCDELYNETKGLFEKHVTEIYTMVSSSDGQSLLQTYLDQWQTYLQGATYVHLLYSYLNTQFIRKQKYTDADRLYGSLQVDQVKASRLEIGELALHTWKSHLLEPISEKLVKILLKSIADDRAGKAATLPSVVHGVIQSFMEIEQYKPRDKVALYDNMFEARLLEETATHYREDAAKLISNLPISQYMHTVIARLQDEERRAHKFLVAHSYDKVREVCHKQMVVAHMPVVQAAAAELVSLERTVDLHNMYLLLRDAKGGLTPLVKEVQSHISRIGLETVQDLFADTSTAPSKFVDGMLSVHTKYTSLIKEVFNNDQEFLNALDKACLSAINHREKGKTYPSAPDWLSRYTDYLLRRGGKGLSETEMDDKLRCVVVIFRYVEDKDIFQKLYARALAHRLIHGLSVNMDAEEGMIAKLKEACGFEFTSKLHRMFTDVGVSQTLTSDFSNHLDAKKKDLGVNFSIMVLQQGAWSLQTSTAVEPFALPTSQLRDAVSAFEEFYNGSFNGRKLTWLYGYSTVDVRLHYLDRPYTISMPLYHLAVLLCFDNFDELSLSEIENITQLRSETLKRQLKSLFESGLLKSSTEGKSDDRVAINLQYSNKRSKFKIIPPIAVRTIEKETEHVVSTSQQDRKHFLECTIVRIMKSRKHSKHNALVQEVMKQSKSRFTADVAFIKKVIEQLIEKQYLQRADNPDEYAYLA